LARNTGVMVLPRTFPTSSSVARAPHAHSSDPTDPADSSDGALSLLAQAPTSRPPFCILTPRRGAGFALVPPRRDSAFPRRTSAAGGPEIEDVHRARRTYRGHGDGALGGGCAARIALYLSCAVSGRVELGLQAPARLDSPGSVQDEGRGTLQLLDRSRATWGQWRPCERWRPRLRH